MRRIFEAAEARDLSIGHLKTGKVPGTYNLKKAAYETEFDGKRYIRR